jgi:hypothetical protein
MPQYTSGCEIDIFPCFQHHSPLLQGLVPEISVSYWDRFYKIGGWGEKDAPAQEAQS